MSYKKFSKDVGILALTQLVGAFCGFLVLPIITKQLGAENYGIWTQLMVSMGLICPVAILNLPWALIRFLAGEKDKKEIRDGVWSVSTTVLALSAVLSLFLILFSGPVSRFFGSPPIFIWFLAAIIIFEFLNQTFYNIFRAFQQIKKYCFFAIFQKLGETGLIISAIVLKYGLTGVFVAALASRIIIFLIMGFFIVKEIGLKTPHFLRMKEYLKFSLPTVPDSFSMWAVQSSDRYLVGFFLGAAFVGYYSSAYTIGLFVINFLVSPFSFLLPALLSKLYDEKKMDNVRTYLRYSLKYFLAIAIPSVFGLTVLSRQILTIVTTVKFAEIGYTVMPIIAISMLFMGSNAIIAQIIGLIKKTKVSAVISMVAALLNFLLNLIFIPKFGIIGAAITTLIAYAFIFFAIWIYSFRYFKFQIDWQFIVKSLIASSLMSLVVAWLNPIGIPKTITAIGVGILIYCVSIFLLKGFEEKEFVLLQQIIKTT
jgi:O-antigen/teichoic acid export membrane protein